MQVTVTLKGLSPYLETTWHYLLTSFVHTQKKLKPK
jgi:hypothetical protein